MMIRVVLIAAWLMSVAHYSKAQKIVSGFEHPQSVASDGVHVYVTNIGEFYDPDKKDGDGFITKLDFQGEILEISEFPEVKLNAPKGAVVIDNVLYITDIDMVIGINLTTKQPVFELYMGQASQGLQDLVAWDKQNLYVSARDTNCIFHINIEKKQFEKLELNLPVPGANSLAVDKQKRALYVTGYDDHDLDGELGKVDLTTKRYMRLADYEGNLNGLMLKGYDLIFSDWGGGGIEPSIYRMNINYKMLRPMTVPEVSTPSDFFLDETNNQLWVPMTSESKMVIIPFTY